MIDAEFGELRMGLRGVRSGPPRSVLSQALPVIPSSSPPLLRYLPQAYPHGFSPSSCHRPSSLEKQSSDVRETGTILRPPAWARGGDQE